MADFITTNIRIPEEDYNRLKLEATKKRQSLAQVIRQKLSGEERKRSAKEVKQLLQETQLLSKKTAKKLKGWDSLSALRQIRDENQK